MKIIAGVLFGVWTAASMPAATGSAFAVDGQGNIWRTGQNLPVALTSNAFQKTETATACAQQQISPFDPITTVYCSHAFVIKQDPSGNVLYATFLGGSSEDAGVAVTTDAQGNAYVAGYTYSADFPVTAGVVQRQNAGPLTPKVVINNLGPFGPVKILAGGDLFVAKFAPDGTLLSSTLLGGSGSEAPSLMAVDAAGSVYIAGTTQSTNFPVTSNGMNHQPQSGYFFARLDPQGASLIYATYSDATIQAFDVDALGNAFLSGVSQASASVTGPYVTEVSTSDGQVRYTTYLPNLNSKFVGSGSAIAANSAGEVWVGFSPAPVPDPYLSFGPPSYPLGPAFLLKLAAGGGSILAETDLDSARFDRLQFDATGNLYAFGIATSAMPAAAVAPLLATACSSLGAGFVLEIDTTGSYVAATYMRQGNGDVDQITAAGQISVYRSVSQTMAAVTQVDLLTVPAMNFGCLQNLASGWVGPGVAPGEIFALFGSNLGPAQAVAGEADESGHFPTSISGVQVTINGTAAPLLMVQSGEIHGVVPFGYSPGVTTVQVQYQDQTALPLDAPDAYNPGIFVLNGQGAVLNHDGTINSPSNPAKLGTAIWIYATGTGTLETPIPDGEFTPLPPPYYLVSWWPQVNVAGVAAEVLWAGSAPGLIAGMTQVNARLPGSLPAGTNLAAVPVALNSPGVVSPSVPISVAP